MTIVVGNATFDQGSLHCCIHVVPTRGLGRGKGSGRRSPKGQATYAKRADQTLNKPGARHPTPPTPPKPSLNIMIAPAASPHKTLHRRSHFPPWPHPPLRICSPPNPPSSPQRAKHASARLLSAHEMAAPHASPYGSGFQDIRWPASSVVWEQMSVLTNPTYFQPKILQSQRKRKQPSTDH